MLEDSKRLISLGFRLFWKLDIVILVALDHFEEFFVALLESLVLLGLLFVHVLAGLLVDTLGLFIGNSVHAGTATSWRLHFLFTDVFGAGSCLVKDKGGLQNIYHSLDVQTS